MIPVGDPRWYDTSTHMILRGLLDDRHMIFLVLYLWTTPSRSWLCFQLAYVLILWGPSMITTHPVGSIIHGHLYFSMCNLSGAHIHRGTPFVRTPSMESDVIAWYPHIWTSTYCLPAYWKIQTSVYIDICIPKHVGVGWSQIPQQK